jgi:hypothetical protein
MMLSIGSWYTWASTKPVLEQMIGPMFKSGNIEISVLDVNAFRCGICMKQDCQGCPPPQDPEYRQWIMKNYSRITFSIDWENDISIILKDHRTFTALQNKPEADPIELGA